MVEKTRARKAVQDEVLREFAPLGKYRVRLLHNPKKEGALPAIDIREYVASETFEGFTRRGIRISERAEIDLLRDILKEVLERNGFVKAGPGVLPLQ